MERLLVVLPTYNERENLADLAAAVQRELPGAELLIIDDGSPDGTGDLADDLARETAGIHVHHRKGKLGLGTAYRWAYGFARERGYDRVFQMDVDFSHDPADLPRLLRASQEGADVVIGSRYVAGGSTPGWSLVRRLVSRGGGLYARAVLGLKVRDPTSGFKCFSRRALARLPLEDLRSEGFAFQVEVNHLAARRGLVIREVPIQFRDRRAGDSKMSLGIFAEGFLVVWRMRRRS